MDEGSPRKPTHMMKSALASQVLVESGQQTGFEFVRVQPLVQSWMALEKEGGQQHRREARKPSAYPKLWPISCAMTCQILLVTAVTPVPEVVCPPLDVDDTRQS